MIITKASRNFCSVMYPENNNVLYSPLY